MMTQPVFVLGMLIASILGGIYHLWKNGGFFKLLLFFLFSWLGFWAGHFAGVILGIDIILVGALRLGTALIGCLVFLFGGDWLSQVKTEENQAR